MQYQHPHSNTIIIMHTHETHQSKTKCNNSQSRRTSGGPSGNKPYATPPPLLRASDSGRRVIGAGWCEPGVPPALSLPPRLSPSCHHPLCPASPERAREKVRARERDGGTERELERLRQGGTNGGRDRGRKRVIGGGREEGRERGTETRAEERKRERECRRARK